MSSIVISSAKTQSDIDAVKQLADQHRTELGFHSRQVYIDSLEKGELFVATRENQVVGFTRFHHRRDHRTTLYEIAVIADVRGEGIGKKLINALVDDCRRKSSRSIRLSCPVELPANQFYASNGFIRRTRRSRPGRSRPLYEWELLVLPERKLTFVASLTSTSSDLRNLIQLWENEGLNKRPFERCIITPLFIESKSIKYVRYIQENWDVEVIFDSGGFFVQQEKITYDELFTRLLEFYLKNRWGQTYVLPDFVPTSRQTMSEIEERVNVTASESIRFLDRLPNDLKCKALGVLQGHKGEHLKLCFDKYINNGLNNIGFGSFDTSGVNAEINRLTPKTEDRLLLVRDMIYNEYIKGKSSTIPNLHLFGVSSPNIINQFKGYLATSFDSSGWQRTAGFGNVYLPFVGRQNVSHKSTALMIGKGMSAKKFYTECERTGHTCPFCIDFPRLQEDRLVRMWHNAIVFSDMMEIINQAA